MIALAAATLAVNWLSVRQVPASGAGALGRDVLLVALNSGTAWAVVPLVMGRPARSPRAAALTATGAAEAALVLHYAAGVLVCGPLGT